MKRKNFLVKKTARRMTALHGLERGLRVERDADKKKRMAQEAETLRKRIAETKGGQQ